MKKFSVSIRKGIDDLLSWSPYANAHDWPVFSPFYDITEEEYLRNPKEYEEKAKQENDKYIQELKEKGEYGQIHTTNFVRNEMPEFDEPKSPTFSSCGFAIPLGMDDNKPPKLGYKYNPNQDENL